MKEKNLPDDNNSKSLEELRVEINEIIEKLESEKNLQNSLDEYQKRWNIQMGKLMKYSKRGIRWGGLMFRSPDVLVNTAFNPLTKPLIWRAITCKPMFGIY